MCFACLEMLDTPHQYGCMGALNDGVTERCGRVRGVIHEMWVVDKSEHPSIKDLRVVGGEGLQVWNEKWKINWIGMKWNLPLAQIHKEEPHNPKTQSPIKFQPFSSRSQLEQLVFKPTTVVVGLWAGVGVVNQLYFCGWLDWWLFLLFWTWGEQMKRNEMKTTQCLLFLQPFDQPRKARLIWGSLYCRSIRIYRSNQV